MRIIPKALILFAFAVCVGCATVPGPPPVHSTVTVFHNLPVSTVGTTYAFVPLAGQETDLEYQTYQNYMRSHFAAKGWVEASRATASLLVSFTYAIDQGRIATVSVPVFGQTGVSGATTFGTIDASGNYSGTTTSTPEYGVTGYEPVSRMQYSRLLRVSIADRASVDASKIRLVYKADVLSVGVSGTMAPVMPAMQEALFKEFPGESGASRHESFLLH